jgi:hypothetical protein
MKRCIVTGGNQGAHPLPSRRFTAGPDAIPSSNRALILVRRHGPGLREAPRVTRLVSAQRNWQYVLVCCALPAVNPAAAPRRSVHVSVRSADKGQQAVAEIKGAVLH